MTLPKFCDILAVAKELALKDEALELIHAIDSGIPPDGDGSVQYRILIDRAYKQLTQKEVA